MKTIPLTRAIGLVALAALMCAVLPRPALADVTAFIGANMTPANRPARGFALGAGLLVVGFEFEYADTTDDRSATAPSLRTGSGNIQLQTPAPILGFQPYYTAGLGMYKETLGAQDHTGFALNTGAGVRVSLIGPLRLRVDYRVLKLGNGALNSPAHRIYAGLNLRF